jgi:hypothetical protein
VAQWSAPPFEPANNAFFPVERDRADGAFDGGVDAAIIDEARQRERITDGVGKLALLDGAP